MSQGPRVDFRLVPEPADQVGEEVAAWVREKRARMRAAEEQGRAAWMYAADRFPWLVFDSIDPFVVIGNRPVTDGELKARAERIEAEARELSTRVKAAWDALECDPVGDLRRAITAYTQPSPFAGYVDGQYWEWRYHKSLQAREAAPE